MRLIDADALMAKIDGIIEYIETEIEQAKQCPEKYARTYIPSAVSQLSGIAHAQQEILEMPSADVVEVVRCKDCKYYDPKECCVAFGDWFGEVNMIPMGFCSLGERREE